ncbi:MAG: capsular biosynthesis protein, partial [Oscillospiraceae bacterium]|nr:capsular biosynthesis protein [Oscillospiraceae bacterium]
CSRNTGLGKYIFKQCPVLAYDEPVDAEVPEELSQFSGNAWRRRTIADAFSRSGVNELKAEHSKWLVIDFYDVICNMNEYKGELFETDDFIRRTGFYKSIESGCEPCYLFQKRSEEQIREMITRFAWEMSGIYGNNIVIIRADLKDKFINLSNRLENMADDPELQRKREIIAMCENVFIQQTDCAVIDISKHFYSCDKFKFGGAHIAHYEHEFYREAGVFLSHILSGGKQRKFTKADDNYISMRNLRLER